MKSRGVHGALAYQWRPSPLGHTRRWGEGLWGKAGSRGARARVDDWHAAGIPALLQHGQVRRRRRRREEIEGEAERLLVGGESHVAARDSGWRTGEAFILRGAGPQLFGPRLAPLLLDATGRHALELRLLSVAVRPAGFGVTFVGFAPIAAVGVCVAAALLAQTAASPLNDGNAVLGRALGGCGELRRGFLRFLQTLKDGLADERVALMLQHLRSHLADVADDVGWHQVLTAVSPSQIVEDLFCAQVETRTEHLLTDLWVVAAVVACRNGRRNVTLSCDAHDFPSN